jgi:uncharacterized protein
VVPFAAAAGYARRKPDARLHQSRMIGEMTCQANNPPDSLWFAGRGAEGLLPHQAGAVGDLLLGQTGDGSHRRALLAEQNSYVKNFGERVIGYGHFVSDDGRDTLGTSFFMQLDDRAAADKFVADEPMNKAGVYQRVEIHRWSNSFQKRAADYARKGLPAGGTAFSAQFRPSVLLIEAGTDYPPGQEPPEILDIFAATAKASQQTRWFRFTDDIVIRVGPEAAEAGTDYPPGQEPPEILDIFAATAKASQQTRWFRFTDDIVIRVGPEAALTCALPADRVKVTRSERRTHPRLRGRAPQAHRVTAIDTFKSRASAAIMLRPAPMNLIVGMAGCCARPHGPAGLVSRFSSTSRGTVA